MGGTERPVNWVRVKSRMLAAVAYDRDWQQLYLKYRSGDVYCYWSVPFQKYEELLAAESKGQYARAHILNCYPYRRVHTAVSTAS
jgi:hypothetical protein